MMNKVSRRAWASIDLDALRNNLARVHALCPRAEIYPIIKCNAYGHGMEQVARALLAGDTPVAGFGVATVDEALSLRTFNETQPMLLLNGFMNREELQECLHHCISPVVHSDYQLELIQQLEADELVGAKPKFWVKYNTGMNRLGMNRELSRDCFLKLRALPGIDLTLMSHFACADDPQNPESAAMTSQQLKALTSLRSELPTAPAQKIPCSMAASAGILQWPESHLEVVRPGVMLYGASPMTGQTAAEAGLQAVMRLSSRLLSIRTLQAGESIGYGATWVCERETRVGTVSIGYGDGYPRAAPNGTPVVVKTASGRRRTQLIGRVSMDMITIDLTGIEEAQINDEVILWGPELGADEVANHTGTIAYELFCRVTSRVPREYP